MRSRPVPFLRPGLMSLAVALLFSLSAAAKPLTLDAFFNAVEIRAVRMAPDGAAVIIATERADYPHNRFRDDVWLYRLSDRQLLPLSNSGHDSSPRWSPDGKWIAFLSDRDGHGDQIYVVSSAGGAAWPLTAAQDGVHTYAWATDSRSLYYSALEPVSAAERATHEKEWKDVQRWREDWRPDQIFQVSLPASGAFPAVSPFQERIDPVVASSHMYVEGLAVSPDGAALAFTTRSRSERIEDVQDYEIDTVDLTSPSHTVTQLTHNQALEDHPFWAADSSGIYFDVGLGSVHGKYRDVQPHLYFIPKDGGAPVQMAADYPGAFQGYTVSGDGDVIATGQLGTQVRPMLITPKGFTRLPARPGTYQQIHAARHGQRIAFAYSTLTDPIEVYVADDYHHMDQARPVTHFNDFLKAYDLPRGHPVTWTADDGTRIEGMLLFPPGKYDAKDLPLFVLIHGGPIDADVNHWEADWYQWASLAASQGWMVFEPNYRGSSGYGDKFVLDIVPGIVSRPGKDILEGVDALMRQGYIDRAHMAVGGYSYGGYMTNWLITQTTEFKAAVTGAGAVEHAANWGNDDMSADDAYMLGGQPWEAEQHYNDEAALWRLNRVTTPTHIVTGSVDIRVAFEEQFLLERALHMLHVPTDMLIFPGENHPLSNNPWHGKIKVREELKWLRQYAWPGAGIGQ